MSTSGFSVSTNVITLLTPVGNPHTLTQFSGGTAAVPITIYSSNPSQTVPIIPTNSYLFSGLKYAYNESGEILNSIYNIYVTDVITAATGTGLLGQIQLPTSQYSLPNYPTGNDGCGYGTCDSGGTTYDFFQPPQAHQSGVEYVIVDIITSNYADTAGAGIYIFWANVFNPRSMMCVSNQSFNTPPYTYQGCGIFSLAPGLTFNKNLVGYFMTTWSICWKNRAGSGFGTSIGNSYAQTLSLFGIPKTPEFQNTDQFMADIKSGCTTWNYTLLFEGQMTTGTLTFTRTLNNLGNTTYADYTDGTINNVRYVYDAVDATAGTALFAIYGNINIGTTQFYQDNNGNLQKVPKGNISFSDLPTNTDGSSYYTAVLNGWTSRPVQQIVVGGVISYFIDMSNRSVNTFQNPAKPPPYYSITQSQRAFILTSASSCSSCTSDTQCATLTPNAPYCNGGKCSQCKISSNCPTGNTCINGSCIAPTTCTANTDCTNSVLPKCDTNITPKVCVQCLATSDCCPDPNNCNFICGSSNTCIAQTTCANSSHCGTNECCVNSVCTFACSNTPTTKSSSKTGIIIGVVVGVVVIIIVIVLVKVLKKKH
jgi:hypothetical protein